MKTGKGKYYFNSTMVISLLFLSMLILITSSCKQKAATPADYINHDKWTMYADDYNRALTGSPVEIKQTEYRDISDTTPDAKGTPMHYQLCKFDRQGNRIYILLSDDVIFLENFYTYDDDGMSYRIVSRNSFGKSNDSIVSVTRSVKEGPGKYKETSTRSDAAAKGYTISYYENGGDVVRSERWFDGELRYKQRSEYSEGKLLRWTHLVKGAKTKTYQYYYSGKGFLDSIIEMSGSRIERRKRYVNNVHGDPVYYEETEDGELRGRQTISYRYDDKGNWIRRIIYSDLSAYGNRYDPTVIGRHSNYKLETREIKY